MKKILFSLFAVSAAMSASAQLTDGSFEAGPGAGTWVESSTNFGTPLCDSATCGLALALDGSWYFWGGGLAVGTLEEASLGQSIVIPQGTTAEIGFGFGNVGGDGSTDDIIQLKIDGNIVWSATGADTAMYPLYTPVTADVSAYADGNAHDMVFMSYQDGGTNFIADFFVLAVDGNLVSVANEVMNHESAVTVYPNPATEQINMQFNHLVNGKASVKIFDAMGALVSAENISEINNKLFTFDVTSMSNGFYFIEIENNGNVTKEKFVVSH
jgi:hypothetical protein